MKPETISDGFGSTWLKECPTCGQETMEIVRPGKMQCAAETGYCSLPHCTKCGLRHEDECKPDYWPFDEHGRAHLAKP